MFEIFAYIGATTTILLFIIISFIIHLAILAFAVSRIYKTEFSILKAFLVLLLQFGIQLAIGIVIFFALGGATLLPLLFGLR